MTIDGRSPAQSFELITDPTPVPMNLCGIVVDGHGDPVPGATVRAGKSQGTTGAEGRFRLARSVGTVDAVAMTVDASDFEPWRSGEPMAWGRRDLRIELERGAGLEVDAATTDGVPVRAFQLRLTRLDGDGRGQEKRVLGAGEHEGGRLRVPSLRRGRWLLRVEPRDRALDVSPFTPIEITGPGPARVAVTVPRRGERTVRLQFGDGTPVAGATVELLDCCGQRERPPDEYERWLAGIDRTPALPIEILQTARTGADGTVALAGPAGVTLSLRTSGAGQIVAIHDGVVLGEPGPFVVTIARGGTVAGKVSPRDVLAQFRRLAGLEPDGPWQDNAPRIVLYRREGGATVDVSGREQGRIGADGAFTVAGLRAGAWDLGVEYDTSDDGRAFWTGWAALGSVDVRDDAVTARDVDLRPIAPGELSGLVLCNGSPFADGEGLLVRSEGVRRNGEQVESYWNVRIDAAGRFSARLLPGEYHLELLDHEMFVPGERVFVGAGGRSEATFTFAAGTLHLRVVSATGEPMRGVVPMFTDPSADWGFDHDVGSDEHGSLTVRLQAGDYEVRVHPRAVGTPELQRAWRTAHGTDAPQLLVATIAIRGGEVVERELRLPPEWDRDVR